MVALDVDRLDHCVAVVAAVRILIAAVAKLVFHAIAVAAAHVAVVTMVNYHLLLDLQVISLSLDY